MAGSSKFRSLAVPPTLRIVLVGCGGTGGFLAEHLVRMIAGFKLACRLLLVDGDTVTRDNIWRQNFMPHEIGQNKAEALALRLSGRFGMAVEYSAAFVAAGSSDLAFGSALIITATDTLVSRRIVADWRPRLWIDCGNDKTYGQAVIGTTHDPNRLGGVYRGWNFKKGYLSDLPNMAAVTPAILKAKRNARKRAGCGQMPFAEQGFGVNATAAQAAATLVKQAAVDGVVTTAAIYFDAAEGRMLPRLIDRTWFQQWKNI